MEVVQKAFSCWNCFKPSLTPLQVSLLALNDLSVGRQKSEDFLTHSQSQEVEHKHVALEC